MGYELNDKEQVMHGLVTQVLDGALTLAQAAAQGGVSERTMRRKVDRYLKEGAGGLAHRSRGRKARNAVDEALKAEIVSLYEGPYAGYNFTHFHQRLGEAEGVHVSYPVVYAALTAAGHSSPRAHGRPRRPHPRRPRRAAFGELVQMDASWHRWFGEGKASLHLAIDDATSRVLGARFEEQETLRGYYMAFAEVLRGYGCPRELYTDRRTVFASGRADGPRLEAQSGTQFRMAAARMGVERLHATSVPQAKGRVERAFQTFQDRLVSEMRTAKVACMEEANAFLAAFVADHNARYALDEEGLERAFGPIPSEHEIDLGLAVVCRRKAKGGAVSYKGLPYAPFDEESRKALPHGAEVLVLRTLSDRLYVVHGDDAWPLVNVETMALPTPEDVKGRIYVPPKDHPWKEASYRAMLGSAHRAA